ncbi:MAG: response regulator [Caulobacteraceae bacterium]|jgi:DNA-directed RNA polymerase specialized sigma24 family protein|nr:response regulator [Caulobacteraceae bacterium]
MNFLATLAPHLPFLRRYARALTGDQNTGDRFVRLTLQSLADGEETLDETLPPRVAFYRLFHTRWCRGERASQGENPHASAPLDAAQSHLMRIAPASRQAFLLTAMEGFTPSETAQILGVNFGEVEGLIQAAQRDIDAELATEVLIIEDEPVIAADIQALVEELGHTVSGLATTRNEARASAARRPPGLVLADIQLADGSSGIDAVKDILSDIKVPVIFITAFPERLLTGERPEPAFLITKPFDPATVKAAIGQALFFHPRRATAPAGR